MAEAIIETPTRLKFDTLFPGDLLAITTGTDTNAWIYDFAVQTIGHWPHGTLEATSPSGDRSGPIDFALHGCGKWTTRNQNPVQTQLLGITPYYDGLIVGSFMLGQINGQPNRARFDMPGQEISKITRAPYRENRVLQILGDNLGAMSVKQVLEVINDKESVLQYESGAMLKSREVRSVLGSLVELGHVSLQKKKVHTFALRGVETS